MKNNLNDLLKQTGNWITRILVWLREASQLWIAIFAIPCVILLCYLMFLSWEQRIRFTGMLLELLGLATVALGIRETRSMFSRPSLFQIGHDWLTSFPKFKRNVQIILGTANATLGGISSSGFSTVSASLTATLEERVTILEKSLNQAHLLIHEYHRIIEQETQQRQSELQVVKRELEDGDSKNKKLLEEAAAGGLHLETTGVFWLFFGIVLATTSVEITKLCCGS